MYNSRSESKKFNSEDAETLVSSVQKLQWLNCSIHFSGVFNS